MLMLLLYFLFLTRTYPISYDWRDEYNPDRNCRIARVAFEYRLTSDVYYFGIDIPLIVQTGENTANLTPLVIEFGFRD